MRAKHPLLFVSSLAGFVAMAGCRQDMHNQPRYKPLAPSDFFGDGRSARPVVEGTVARGHLRIDKARYTGKENDMDVTEFPFPITRADLLRGQERFNIYCSPCHSRIGDGNGMVVRRGFRQAASYHTDKLSKAPIGHFFDVMTNGFGAMPSYASRVEPDDRWRIAAYIRVLQFSEDAKAVHDANIQSKAVYLNIPFFIGRALIYFAVWFLYSHLLTKWSAEQDRTGDERLIGKMRAISAPGLVVFTITATFAFIDWIMSLEPHWFSTIYGAMFIIGEMLESFAFVIALMIVLSKLSAIKKFIMPQHLHDLGNMMFAFMVLWAYLSFSQFLIIWAGNLPPEIPWYVSRLRGGWGWVALTLVVFHFATPFVLLLMRGIKRRAHRLFRVCLLMIALRLVDVYWITEPAFFGQNIRIHWMDFVTPLAVGGLWLAVFFGQLRSRPLLPMRDPRLQGAPREMVAF